MPKPTNRKLLCGIALLAVTVALLGFPEIKKWSNESFAAKDGPALAFDTGVYWAPTAHPLGPALDIARSA